jgi:hypothetical protein
MVIFRDARRADVPSIVALLADDMLGASRETALNGAYWAAFDQIAADSNNRLIVAEIDGRIAGTLQLTMLPGLSRHGMLRAQIEAVRVAGRAARTGTGPGNDRVGDRAGSRARLRSGATDIGQAASRCHPPL